MITQEENELLGEKFLEYSLTFELSDRVYTLNGTADLETRRQLFKLLMKGSFATSVTNASSMPMVLKRESK